eukprot:TRINITY_DN16611_c0_g1_i1.p1 TRINITY_DN16611_c0_g1~~TRINITY_DN16611_c0_g1_i1.p1  ORF type:complete len:723 (-),score=162.85 TRINITY_DN16611_c0_g1_i1:110-2278(-)
MAASGSGGPSSCPPVAKQYYCKLCLDSCTIHGSKPGPPSDPLQRIETRCVNLWDNLKRRCRAKPPGDALVAFTKSLEQDKQKKAAWLKRQKTRAKNVQQDDQDLMVISEEVESTGLDSHAVQGWLSFSMLQFDNALMAQDDLLELWKAKCALATHKKTVDNVDYISMPVALSDDRVNSKRFNEIQRNQIRVGTEAAIAAAHEELARHRTAFARAMDQETRRGAAADAPEDASEAVNESGLVDAASSTSRAMSTAVLQEAGARGLRAAQQRQAKTDEEDMQALESKQMKVEQDRNKEDPKEELRKKVVGFQTSLIEKIAKLEASIVTLKGNKTKPEYHLGHLEGDAKADAERSLNDLEKQSDDAISSYKAQVEQFVTKYKPRQVQMPSALEEVQPIIDECNVDYQKFWSPQGFQKPFRDAIRSWKKKASDLEKEEGKWQKAKIAGAKHKRKAAALVEDPEELPPVATCIREDVLQGRLDAVGFSESVGEFPHKAIVIKGMEGAITDFAATEGWIKMSKWVHAQATKLQEPEYSCEIMNKKFLQETVACFSKVDSTVRPRSEILFPPSQAEIRDTLFSYQVQTIGSRSFEVNVTPFCLPEARVAVAGTYGIFGIPLRSASGDDVPAKIAAIHKMGKSELLEVCSRDGFITMVKPGHVYVIPAGVLLMTFCAATEPAIGLRWSFLTKAIADTVAESIDQLMQAHAHLLETDYKTVFDTIKADLAV